VSRPMRRRRSLAALAGPLVLAVTACSLAPVTLPEAQPLGLRTTITAADGSKLARIYRENRAAVSIERIPQHVIDAVLAAEDARFFKHHGYDLRAITRAAIVNWREGKIVQGGSTITQQYVKNTYFRDPERTLERKAREIRIAIELEKQFTKEEILEKYLNTVYFGDGAYGIKAAAETYFGHGTEQLDLPQAAMLAGLIRAPSKDSPRDHPHRALERRNLVLSEMKELELITATEAADATAEPLRVLPDPPRIATKEPYFVEAVKREILNDKRFGQTEQDRARALFKGGLKIETTLDPELQRAARSAVDSILNQPGDPEAALVAIEPKTGEIRAMVAGRDWNASQVNLALGKAGGGSGRQPGSAFKGIVAATALETGIQLNDEFETGPVQFTFDDGTVWTVQGGGSASRLTMGQALAESSNGVFARLGLQLGAGRIGTQANIMGVKTHLPDVPSLALGAAEVSVLDMAAAYATIANHGIAVEPTTIRKITTSDDVVIEPDQEVIQGAMSPGNAYFLTTALEGVITHGTGTAANIGRPAAGKTGTTNDYADAWFVGFTPQLVTAVWVGYPQGRVPMTSVHGITVLGGTFPAMIWRAFMLRALRGEPVMGFHPPKWAFVEVEIDPRTGLLSLPWCPGEMVEMLREQVPTEYCPNPDALPPPPIYSIINPTPSPDDGKGKGDKKGQEPDDDKDGGGKPEPEPKPEPTEEPKPDPSPSPTP
jgi:1A family penicillin-binding protein